METLQAKCRRISLIDQSIELVDVPVLYASGNYAVTPTIANTMFTVLSDDKYTVTHKPSGICFPVWFAGKEKARKFCDWVAANFPDATTKELKRRKKEIKVAMREFSGEPMQS